MWGKHNLATRQRQTTGGLRSGVRLTALLFFLFLLTLSLACPLSLRAEGSNDFNPIPEHKNLLYDEAGVLTKADADELEAINRSFGKTGLQFAVCIFRSAKGEPMEELANRIFRGWKLGDEQKNNGVLMVVALEQRKVRIETGYGVEAYFTDAYCGDVLRTNVTPLFKKQEYGEGIMSGLERMATKMAKVEDVKLTFNIRETAKETSWWPVIKKVGGPILVVGLGILVFWLLSLLIRHILDKRDPGWEKRGKYSSSDRRYDDDRYSSGSSYDSHWDDSNRSGGGGSSGGGGATGDW